MIAHVCVSSEIDLGWGILFKVAVGGWGRSNLLQKWVGLTKFQQEWVGGRGDRLTFLWESVGLIKLSVGVCRFDQLSCGSM